MNNYFKLCTAHKMRTKTLKIFKLKMTYGFYSTEI